MPLYLLVCFIPHQNPIPSALHIEYGLQDIVERDQTATRENPSKQNKQCHDQKVITIHAFIANVYESKKERHPVFRCISNKGTRIYIEHAKKGSEVGVEVENRYILVEAVMYE